MPGLKEFEAYQPIGYISDETRQWLKDPNAKGPGMFTANRNGQGGMWALYSGADFQRVHALAAHYQDERQHLLRCKSIVKDLLAWYDNGQRTMHELDRILDVAADLVQR